MQIVNTKEIERKYKGKIMESARVSFYKFSFFVRIIKHWNDLPNHLFNEGQYKPFLKEFEEAYEHL